VTTTGVDVDALLAALDEFVPALLRARHVPGMNLAVALDGEIAIERGYGFANLETKTPMTPDTVMHSGSMGKTYTATAVMQLVEQGRLALDGPINDYLDFTVTNPLGARDITVRDLMTHRSGMVSNNATSTMSTPRPLGEHLKDSYEQSRHDFYHGTVLPKWTLPVGETFQYSNTGIATLGYLVERANSEGLSFSDYVQRHIIDPLGMTSTQYPPVQDAPYVRDDIKARFSTGYAGLGPLNLATPTIFFADFPAGCVVTTPGDHIKVLLAYLNKGQLADAQILQPDTIEQMLTPQVTAPMPSGVFELGLVWRLQDRGQPLEWFGHSGGHMFGWHNDYRGYPNLGLAVSVATNRWDMEWWRHTVLQPAPINTVCDFIAKWVAERRAGRPQPSQRPRPWRVSYVVGLIMGDSLYGELSIAPVPPEGVETMARFAYADAETLSSLWDADGFRAGIADILGTDGSRDGIKTFMESDALQVERAELELLYREVGGMGQLPVPLEGIVSPGQPRK
jgi:CubicO group peptidase (beta-lactamase class C family)